MTRISLIKEIILNAYVILLQRMQRAPRYMRRLSLEPQAIGEVARSAGVHIFDIVVTLGDFEAVLLLAAPNNAAVAKLLNGLEGWWTVALSATAHSRYELTDVLRVN